jgi:hypothetical protein
VLRGARTSSNEYTFPRPSDRSEMLRCCTPCLKATDAGTTCRLAAGAMSPLWKLRTGAVLATKRLAGAAYDARAGRAPRSWARGRRARSWDFDAIVVIVKTRGDIEGSNKCRV